MQSVHFVLPGYYRAYDFTPVVEKATYEIQQHSMADSKKFLRDVFKTHLVWVYLNGKLNLITEIFKHLCSDQ
ncbi:MAG: hypothetical protein QXR93_01070 [Archaeoglobaceae archaeon]